jgi:type II secretory pathway pseudopilin PulG
MSLDDRLSLGGGPLGGLPPEQEPEEQKKPSRAFTFIAIAMGGLILLGILALVGALVIWVPQQKARQIAQVTETVAAMTIEAASWTPTPIPTNTPALPTWTPTMQPTQTTFPTPTATRVVSEKTPEGRPTATPTKPASAEWGASTPSAGLGGLGIAAIAVGLSGLAFAARKLRK